MIIYSAIYGGYDIPKPQPQLEGVEYVMFTDQTIPQELRDVWNVYVDDRLPDMSARMRAKWFKLHSHDLFPGEKNIWIDGSVTVTPQIIEFADVLQDNEDAVFSRHPWRTCIYKEADECWMYPKYIDQPIKKQVNHYREQGMPENFGLWAGTVIARKDAKQLNEEWWKENLKWSYQDQLSLSYIVWKYGFKIRTFKEIYPHSDYITVSCHTSEK